jgi:hypothetical protein
MAIITYSLSLLELLEKRRLQLGVGFYPSSGMLLVVAQVSTGPSLSCLIDKKGY